MICSRISRLFRGRVDVSAAWMWEGRMERGTLGAGLYARLDEEGSFGIAPSKELETRYFCKTRITCSAASGQRGDKGKL